MLNCRRCSPGGGGCTRCARRWASRASPWPRCCPRAHEIRLHPGGGRLVRLARGAHAPAPMARILIVGGGSRGRRLAGELARGGHLLRIATRVEERRAVIESSGAECSIATPMQIGTLRPALEGTTLACWLFACASGGQEELRTLHGSRLELFLHQLIDTPVRGFIYDASPGV